MSRTALAVLMMVVGGGLLALFRFVLFPLTWIGVGLLAGGTIIVVHERKHSGHSRRKRELWARLDEASGEDRLCALEEAAGLVGPRDVARLRELAVDPDPRVRPLATRLLHKAELAPERVARGGAGRAVANTVACILVAVAVWQDGGGPLRALAALAIAALIVRSAVAGVVAVVWLALVGVAVTLATVAGPPGWGWIAALLAGVIVLVVSLTEPPARSGRARDPR